jgi:hypothetical protein
MNCEQFRTLIHDLAREEASDDAQVISALNHAESCRDCDARLRKAEKLTAALRALAIRHNSEAAPPRVEAALLQAMRQQHQPARVSIWRSTASWLTLSGAALATAAVFVFLLLGNHARTSGHAPAPIQQSAPRETNRPAAQRPAWADYAINGETEEQAAAEYIPLTSDFDPSWLEGGAIVRVLLTRPALESLGVPAMASSDDQMLADMVVSDDGTPEAIRLVDWQVSDGQ